LLVELLEDLDLLLGPLLDLPDLLQLLGLLGTDLAADQILGRELVHQIALELRSFFEEDLAPLLLSERSDQLLSFEEVGDLLAVLLAKDPDLVVQVLLHPRDGLAFDRLRPAVLLDPLAAEDLDVDDGSLDARRRGERGVADIARLLATPP